jgi:hypothetical protein
MVPRSISVEKSHHFRQVVLSIEFRLMLFYTITARIYKLLDSLQEIQILYESKYFTHILPNRFWA